MLQQFACALRRKVRFILLAPLFRLFTGSTLWSEEAKDRYEEIFLYNALAEEKEKMLLATSTSLMERSFLWIYLRYPFPRRDRGYHVDVVKYLTLHLHCFFGMVDDTFESDIDDHIASVYDPLRHFIACEIWDDDDDDGKTLPVFRFAQHFVTVKSITDDIFKGVTRPVNILSDQDISKLYYDVLQRSSCAVVEKATKRRILSGQVTIIALSYRHHKNHRDKLGITKREFIAALRALHAAAEPANPPNEYCVWWDSCLKCLPMYDYTQVNWASIGLVPYAFCHVLSVRRAPELEEDRLWIDMERGLARLSKGLTVVDVTNVRDHGPLTTGDIVGFAQGFLTDPQYALEEGLKYITTGDLCFSKVTFPLDKLLLERAVIKMLCVPRGLGAFRALYDSSRLRIEWVQDWASLEERAFMVAVQVRLGKAQVIDGEGEADLDVPIKIQGRRFRFDDRRSWLPNSVIYEFGGSSEELPYFVKEQVALLVENKEQSMRHDKFGLLLYYEEDTRMNSEAIHGCIANFVRSEEQSYIAESTSRLHVPRSSKLLESFKDLYVWGKNQDSTECMFENLRGPQDAVAWPWEENEMDGQTVLLAVRVLRSS